ncbi:MAG: MBL fold metallo-hydrolase [Nocardioides sp.]|uniref:MBL fold metallo-hydrolase n=1 Tax=Nocardioides sp. TaxID=35761 RepID=UPI0039E3EC19
MTSSFVIKRLNFGSVRIDESMRVRGVPPGHSIEVPAQGWLILGGDKPILVDAGYRDPSVLGAGGTVASGQGFHDQLRAHGVSAEQLGYVILTHAHRDHAGHVDKIPLQIPVVLDRAELAAAASGLQGLAYARDDVHHLIDRLYTPGGLRLLDLERSGPVETSPGITCVHTGGHTAGSLSVIVPTAEGDAYLCGDLFYDVETALHTQPRDTFVAAVQPAHFDPYAAGLTNNFTVGVIDELAATQRARRYRFVVPAHDDPAVLDHGQYCGRILGDTIPGPIHDPIHDPASR